MAPSQSAARRTLRVLLALVVLLALGFYGGGGWYFAGRLRADGLTVSSYPDVDDLRVDASGDRLTITRDGSTAGRDDLARVAVPSTYGVVWKGGYAQVSGAPVSTSGRRVVRTFRLLSGTAPSSGAPAHLDLDAFPAAEPALALGPNVREIRYASRRGTFPAYLAKPGAAPGTTWAVLVHGKGGSRAEMFRMGRAMLAAGLTTLDLSYRNDPGQARDASGYYRYGQTEWQDLAGAVHWAADHGATRVVLGADSMGGAIVASYLRHRRAHQTAGIPVLGAVLDSPMLDFSATVRHRARQIALPVVGAVPDSLTWVARQITAVRFGVDWHDLDYLDGPAWDALPLLVFHGDADQTVPLSTSRDLARTAPEARLVVTHDTDHVRSWNTDPERYQTSVVAFVDGLG